MVPPTAAQYGSSRNVNSLGVAGTAQQVSALTKAVPTPPSNPEATLSKREKMPSSHVVGRLNVFEYCALDILKKFAKELQKTHALGLGRH